jgi:FdhD protein
MVAEETAVSMTYNRLSHAVMMATPADLADFAIGFSLTEGLIAHPGEIEEFAAVAVPDGIELRMWLAAGRMEALTRRRRRLAGATGCGLCGLESLAEAMRPPPPVAGAARYVAAELLAAVAALPAAQTLGQQTRAAHAAAFWTRAAGIVALREDVGRHNALDKLAGALARQGIGATGIGATGIGATGIGATGIGATGIAATGITTAEIAETGSAETGSAETGSAETGSALAGSAAMRVAAAEGVLLLTSRVSVELVQKAAVLGVPVVVAVSAPTVLAVRMAELAGITLVGVARTDGFEVFTHADRIV